MSFSQDIKNELSRLKLEEEHLELVELGAFARMNGSMTISNKKLEFEFVSENSAISRRIFTLVKKLYQEGTEVSVSKNNQLKKNNTYSIKIKDSDSAEDFLKRVVLLDEGHTLFNLNYDIPKGLFKSKEDYRAYIRASFLASGSVTDPEKGYHLEFVCNSKTHAQGLKKLINSYGLNSKIVERKDSYVVYIKNSEMISDCLNIMGSVEGLLEYENVRAMKDFRNGINRIVNCETANLSKTVEASMRQVQAIEKIQNTIGISSIPEKLREVCYLRLEHKEMSLAEIGRQMSPPQTKAVVNQRFKQIEKISEKL